MIDLGLDLFGYISFLTGTLVFFIFVYFYYKLLSKRVKVLDESRSFLKESISVFFKHVAPVVFIVFFIAIVATNMISFSLYRFNLAYIIPSIIVSFILLFPFLIIPIYSSLYFCDREKGKGYFSRFLLHSLIIDIAAVVIGNLSVIAWIFLYCKFERCQSEVGLTVVYAWYISAIFFVSFLVFSFIVSELIFFVKKGYGKYIYLILGIVLIATGVNNFQMSRPMEYYLQSAIDNNDISYCDKMPKNTRNSRWYEINECKGKYIIFKSLGADKCNEYISQST